jgi:succinoglycan biosynthesis protein ExoU
MSMVRAPATDAVSVIIAARDAADTVARAVASALAQPEAAEVVVIDDGSTDDTLEASLSADDGSGRLILRRLETSVGPAAARNLAIRSCGAPILAVLDADDYFLPGRLAALLEHLPGFDFVADDLLLEDANGRRQRLVGCRLDAPVTLSLTEFVLGNVTRRGSHRRELGFLKPLMRREFLEQQRLCYDGALRLGEDFVLYARALALGARFRLAPFCGYVAGQRPGSLSHRHSPEDLRALVKACERLSRLESLGRAEHEALLRHRRQIAQKLHLRDVLTARRAGGISLAARVLLSAPGAMGYVLGQMLSDKLRLRAGRTDAAIQAR